MAVKPGSVTNAHWAIKCTKQQQGMMQKLHRTLKTHSIPYISIHSSIQASQNNLNTNIFHRIDNALYIESLTVKIVETWNRPSSPSLYEPENGNPSKRKGKSSTDKLGTFLSLKEGFADPTSRPR